MQSIVLSPRCTRKLDLESAWQLRCIHSYLSFQTSEKGHGKVAEMTGAPWRATSQHRCSLHPHDPSSAPAWAAGAGAGRQHHFPVAFCPIGCWLCQEPQSPQFPHPSRSQIPRLLRSPPCQPLSPPPTLLKHPLCCFRHSSAPPIIFYLFVLLFVSVSIPTRNKGHILTGITVGESIYKGMGRVERNQKKYGYTPRPPPRHLSHL